MTKLPLTVACAHYDFLQPLRDGKVQVEGIDLNLIAVDCNIRHHRMLEQGEYDACEFSMGTYLVARAMGIDRLQAIPFFPRRMFAHRFCFIRAGSDIERPSDLRGRRVGLLTYQNSLAVAAKAVLMHDHGLAPTGLTWVTTGKERVDTPLPADLRIERARPGRTLVELLLAGEIDAMVEPDLPRPWLEGDGTLAPLFVDTARQEREYYQRTRLLPLMHPIVIQQEILARHPWVAMSLFDAFEASRRLHREHMQQPHRLSFAWPPVAEERAFFARDPFAQGFAANRHDVDGMIRYCAEQGLLARPLTAEELFAATTLET